MNYDNRHRILLQTVMHVGVMSDYDFQHKVIALFGSNNDAELYIRMINDKLEPLNMAVKHACCDLTGQKYWMFMNTCVDDIFRFQTEFSQAQLEFLHKVFEEIIKSSNGCASSMTCLNIRLDHRLNKADREDFLNEAVRRMWLISKDGHYFMGVRSIIEMMPYFTATYPEGFNNCPVCKQAVFHGQRCEGCEAVAHLHCLANFARIEKPLKCSKCSTVIPTDGLPEPQEPMIDQEPSSQRSDDGVGQKRKKKTNKTKNRR